MLIELLEKKFQLLKTISNAFDKESSSSWEKYTPLILSNKMSNAPAVLVQIIGVPSLKASIFTSPYASSMLDDILINDCEK